MVRQMAQHFYLTGGTAVHIINNMLEHLIHRGVNRFWQRADFREAVSNQLQALHILVHLRQQVVLRILLFQHLHPRHQA